MFKLIPSTFALSARQRQTAASKSTNPSINAQHLLSRGDFPILIIPKTLAQTPKFKVSIGHFPWDEGGVAEGGCVGLGDGGVEAGCIGLGDGGVAEGCVGLGDGGGVELGVGFGEGEQPLASENVE